MLGCVLGARDARRACSCFKSWRNGARYGGWEPSGGPNAGRFPASAPLSVPREQTMRDVRAEKALLRSRLLDARAKSSAEERTSGGRLIRDAVLSLPELQMAGGGGGCGGGGCGGGRGWWGGGGGGLRGGGGPRRGVEAVARADAVLVPALA